MKKNYNKSAGGN